MNRMHRCVVMLVFGLLAVSTAFAQMGMRMSPELRGYWKPVVGNGGAYEMTSPDGTKSQMEFAIVGKDTVDGKDGVWMEMTMSNPRMGGQMLVKYFVAVDGSQMTFSRMIMQMPGRPPMEMPQNMTQGRKPIQYEDIQTNATDVGSESVTVPAGTFQCEHWKMKDGSGDAWVSDKISPFGLVKYQGSKSDTMVLTKQVTDAKDKMVGTPIPFDPMKMMQQAQQPQQ